MRGAWFLKAMAPVVTSVALIGARDLEPVRAEPVGARGGYAVVARGEARLAGRTLAQPRVSAATPLNQWLAVPPEGAAIAAVNAPAPLPEPAPVPALAMEPTSPGHGPLYGLSG